MGDVVDVSWSDLLRTEGVDCKGFGILPKYPMLDRDLSLTAKAIYAYICSLAGNGETAFPGRDTILSQLGINKNTYYSHFKQLTEQGYISVTQQAGPRSPFGHNIYCICSNPKKFAEASQRGDTGILNSSLSFQGLKSAGYGTISRAIMMDDRISFRAKALYAYFSSFTGAGKVAFPKFETILYHLDLSKSTYYKYLNELIAHNYLVVQQRFVNGRRGVNEYILVDKPQTVAREQVEQLPKKQDTVKQDTVKQDTVKQDAVKQDTVKQDTVKQDTVKQDTVKQDTTINSVTINSPTKIISTRINPIIQGDEIELTEEERKKRKYRAVMRMFYSRPREALRSDLRETLGFEDFDIIGVPPNIDQLNSLVEIILDYICAEQNVIKISGAEIDKLDVAEVMFSLDIEHLNYVIDCVNAVKTPIKNLKAYYLKCLYEAPHTYELYIQRQMDTMDGT